MKPAYTFACVLSIGCAGELPADGTGKPDDTALEGLQLDVGDAVACAAPRAAPSWVDVGVARGLAGAPAELEVQHTVGGAPAVADFDGDGDFDIALNFRGYLTVYLRDGDSYTPISGDTPPTRVDFMSIADINGDGLPEILAGGAPVHAYAVKDGTVVRSLIGQSDSDFGFPAAQQVLPADLDDDGLIDLFGLVTDPRPDFLLRGVGDGWFEAVEGGVPAAPDDRTGLGFDARWFDSDGDLDLDLYVVNDQGPTFGENSLYENVDGQLVEVSATCGCDLSVSAMGVDAGDYDNDGNADLYVTESAGAALLRSLGDGTFVDVTLAVGIPGMDLRDMGWGAIFVDFDNDGDLDIFQPMGDLWESAGDSARVFDSYSELLVQTDGQFSDQASVYGFDRAGSWRSVVAWDDNADGVLDLLVTEVEQAPMLWLSEGCTAAGWIEVEGPIGARVEVTAGGVTRTAWVTSQSGYSAGRPQNAHVGLGEEEEVDSVVVTLPNGERYVADGPLAARRILRVPAI